MQREIKFRSYDKEKKLMISDQDQSWAKHYPDVLPGHWLHNKVWLIGKITETLMQFTGLKDKNGLNEIYESDIIKEGSSGLHYEIKFTDGSFGYASTCLCKESIDEYEIEVVGNIWEHNIEDFK